MCISVCWCCLLGCLFLCCRLPIWKRRHVPSNVPTYFEESSSVGDYERWVYKKHYWAVNFIQLTHDLCHILSHLPVIVTLSSFVVECAFPSSLSVPSSSLHTHTHCCHFTTCSFWICSTLELPSQSPVVRCAAAMMICWQRNSLGFLILPTGIKAWCLVKSHSLYSWFRWHSMTCWPKHLISAGVMSFPELWPQGPYLWFLFLVLNVH